jgi:hypothetical protein
VKLIGSGIGLAHEYRAARKTNATNATPTVGESSRSAAERSAPINEAPPVYVELSETDADEMIANGHAVPADHNDKKGDYKNENGEYPRDVKTQHEGNDVDDVGGEEDNDGDERHGDDEEQWDLDDAVEEQLAHTPSEDEPVPDYNVLVDNFMRAHAPPAYAQTGKLPFPVIIPQRRPRDKTRGFIRAYAPVLENCGIDQQMFLDFLKTFHQSSASSPWLDVVNIGAVGAGFAPSGIATAVSIAVRVATGVAMEVQQRTR